MAIQITGTTGTTIAEVDPTQKAQRVSMRPYEVLSWASVGAQSGALTGLAAGAPVLSVRNLSANNILLRRLSIGFVLTTAFGTAQIVDFGMMVARSFTASDSGGTTLLVSGTANGKHRTALANPTSLDVRIATTGALTAGTRTLDANYLGQVPVWAGAIGANLPLFNLFSHDTGDYPLVLAQNEGFILAAVTAWGATGVGRLYAGFEFAEAATSAF